MTEASIHELKAFLTCKTNGPKVIMLCGIAGAGKSTLAKSIAKECGFKRLSIDQTVFESHGLYGVDYNSEDYEELSDKAEQKVMERLLEHVRAKENVVLDRSYWSREDRDVCYTLLQSEGVRNYKLVYLRASKDFLWKRVQARKKETLGADNAVDLTEEIIERYCAGFEDPGEDEAPIVINAEESYGKSLLG
jgi:predicted kinase